MSETAWWVIIVAVTNLLVAVVIIDTYRRRVYQLRRRHAEQRNSDQMELAHVRMLQQLYGSVPIEKLIGYEEASNG